MLDKQINMYSIDTGHFYTNHEKYLHDMNCKYRRERNYVANKLPDLEKALAEYGYGDKDFRAMKRLAAVDIVDEAEALLDEYQHWCRLIVHKRQKAKESKAQLLKLLENRVEHNVRTKGCDHIRAVREDSLNDNNVISVFESALSRTIGIQQDELTDALMVVQVYYFDVFKDISFFGFTYKGEKYRYFTSSAGQIRKKKAVFIKESVWERIEKTVMCGLTTDKINAMGGNNPN